MAETPEQQRERLYRKRIKESSEELIQCLECSLSFRRVGSHVVQVHGYKTVSEYRDAHGLKARETRTESYAKKMKRLASNKENLELGAPNRFKKGGSHGEYIKKWWNNRREKHGFRDN